MQPQPQPPYVDQGGLKLLEILMPLSPEHWVYRSGLPHVTSKILLNKLLSQYVCHSTRVEVRSGLGNSTHIATLAQQAFSHLSHLASPVISLLLPPPHQFILFWGMHVYPRTHVRGKLMESPLFPPSPCGSQESNWNYQTWWQVS